MTKKQIQALVKVSYSKGQLDEKKVERIASLLKRSELKEYVRSLKLAEKARVISLVLPHRKFYNKSRSFNGKEVKITEDPTLLLGIKIVENDMVYDMSLKNSLKEIVQSV